MRLPTLFSTVLGAVAFAAALPTAIVEGRDGPAAPANPGADTTSSPSYTCSNPQARKEWRSFTNPEKAAFLNAVKCLANQPHNWDLTQSNTGADIPNMMKTDTSLYDDAVFIHIDLNHHIHSTGWFFPWHRWYVNLYGRLLKTQCGYNGVLPYWDWTQDTEDFEHATFWDPDPDYGVGTWGDPTQDYQLIDGAWSIDSTFKLHYPSTHAIRRQFTPQPYQQFPYPYLVTDANTFANTTFTAARVAHSLENFDGDYQGFQKDFQAYEGPHAGVHLIVGADLTGLCPANAPPDCVPGESWSPNDPLFFMHHAMVDKVWYDWQNRNDVNKVAFTGGSTQHLASLADYTEYPLGSAPWLDLDSIIPTDNFGRFDTQWNVKVSDVMDTQGGYLCYTYE